MEKSEDLTPLLAILVIAIFLYSHAYRTLLPRGPLLTSVVSLGLAAGIFTSLTLILYRRIRLGLYVLAASSFSCLLVPWFHAMIETSATISLDYTGVLVLLLVTGGIAILFKKGKASLSKTLIRKNRWNELEEFEPEPQNPRLEDGKEDSDLSTVIGLLNEVQCKILLTLLESGKQYSKKELQKIIGTTYKRVLRAVEGLEELGLVEIKELHRRARGAYKIHFVKVSPRLSTKDRKIREMVKWRLKELKETS